MRIQAISAVKKGAQLLNSIWAMRHKKFIGTGKMRKYKMRLQAHGGQQNHGVSYWESFAPVVMVTTIQLILNMILKQGRKYIQLDFFLAYPHANVEGTIYMRLPRGFKLSVKQGRPTSCKS